MQGISFYVLEPTELQVSILTGPAPEIQDDRWAQFELYKALNASNPIPLATVSYGTHSVTT
jgi:hypothetical protein